MAKRNGLLVNLLVCLVLVGCGPKPEGSDEGGVPIATSQRRLLAHVYELEQLQLYLIADASGDTLFRRLVKAAEYEQAMGTEPPRYIFRDVPDQPYGMVFQEAVKPASLEVEDFLHMAWKMPTPDSLHFFTPEGAHLLEGKKNIPQHMHIRWLDASRFELNQRYAEPEAPQPAHTHYIARYRPQRILPAFVNAPPWVDEKIKRLREAK